MGCEGLLALGFEIANARTLGDQVGLQVGDVELEQLLMGLVPFHLLPVKGGRLTRLLKLGGER